jgi:C4-type Zn-finger protein
MPKKCPVCSHVLKKRYSRNLSGKKIINSLSCKKCNYHAEEGKWMPKRYRFEKG